MELASRLASIAPPQRPVPLDQTHGLPQARGAEVTGTLVHSVRLPGFVISLESIFGQESETLTLRHTAGQSAAPYVEAIRKVQALTGLVCGLDRVMEWTW